MPAERVTLPSNVAVEESAEEVVVSVQALWDGLGEASGGLFPYLSYSSASVPLQQALSERRIRAVQSASFA